MSHSAKCPAVTPLKLRLVLATASRPLGFTEQTLCKRATLRTGLSVAGASPAAARPGPVNRSPIGNANTWALNRGLRPEGKVSSLSADLDGLAPPTKGLALRAFSHRVNPSAPMGLPKTRKTR